MLGESNVDGVLASEAGVAEDIAGTKDLTDECVDDISSKSESVNTELCVNE